MSFHKKNNWSSLAIFGKLAVYKEDTRIQQWQLKHIKKTQTHPKCSMHFTSLFLKEFLHKLSTLPHVTIIAVTRLEEWPVSDKTYEGFVTIQHVNKGVQILLLHLQKDVMIKINNFCSKSKHT